MTAHSRTRRALTPRTLRSTAAACAVAAFGFGVTASALAAHPKHGKRYSGFTSQPKVQGFSAPVSFKVSADGTKLLNFTYASLGCIGFGGLPPGVDPFKAKFAIMHVGTVKVAKNGHFSVKDSTSTFRVKGQSTVTTSTITGRFKTAKKATGSITFGQRFKAPQFPPSICGPAHLKFTAKAG